MRCGLVQMFFDREGILREMVVLKIVEGICIEGCEGYCY